MVITLKDVPAEIQAALERMAAEQGKTLDRVTLDVLVRGLGTQGSEESRKVRDLSDVAGKKLIGDEEQKMFDEQRRIAPLGNQDKRDISQIVGTWVADPEFEAALEEQRRIDPDLWQ